MAWCEQRVGAALRKVVGDFQLGRLVLLIDDREDRGYLVASAATASTEVLVYLSTYGRGAVAVTLPAERLGELGLSPLAEGDSRGRDYCMPVDAEGGAGPLGHAGMAGTVRALAAPSTAASDLIVPGHVFPLRIDERGLCTTMRSPEAAAELAEMATGAPAAVICDACDEQGGPADAFATQRLAGRLSLKTVTISELALERERQDPGIVRAVGIGLPTVGGPLEVTAFVNSRSGEQYYTFWNGTPGKKPVDVYVHVRCWVGDVFGGRCGCGAALREAVARIHRTGRGMIVYVERDDADGVRHLVGGPARNLNVVDLAAVMRECGVSSARVRCNEPLDLDALAGLGIEIVDHDDASAGCRLPAPAA